MQELTCEEILQATKGTLLCGNRDTVFSKVNTDSRKAVSGDLFIPIVGERFDGHAFIMQAMQAGISGTLTMKPIEGMGDKPVILVEDTLKALGEIAKYYRSKFDIPFIGITGSVGKTSTKDMVSVVLARKYRVLKTEGNFNNEIGLPLTVFNLDDQHEVGVVEMGMSGFGEIRRLTSIARPKLAVITNIGMSHIEKLGSRQNILKAKMEILEGLHPDGLVVLNGDDNLLSGLKGLLKFRTVLYGMEEGMDYQAYNITTAGEGGTSFFIMVNNKEYKVHVPAPGVHHVHNALVAIAVGIELGVPMEEIVQGISQFNTGKMRLNIISQNGIKVINDVYNASPQSMEAAINVLTDIDVRGRRIAVLGDMLEMGEWAPGAHLEVGKYAASKAVDYIVAVGENARFIAEGAAAEGMQPSCIRHFSSNPEAGAFLEAMVAEGDVVLVKGSRGMRMEELVNRLTGNT